ncbi:hemicentin-1-like [Rhinoderma darwinii]|uniref:hemicentin-1-like n=1 Tax=Rhinoderma darwinii TaxID=43563 RepID=UPI003F676B7E
MSDRIVAGNMVTLQCDAGNQNVTTYTFYRDQKTICTEPHVICRGSFLDFRPISGNDNGIYTCSIQNPVSTSTSNSLNVTVSDLTSPTNVVNGTFGGSINFDVFVRLPENYHIEWTFGETGNVTVVAQIYLGGIPQYQPQYRGRSELFINGTLRINNLTYADKGDYNLYVFDQKNFSTHIKLYELQLFPTLHAPSLHIMSDRIVAGNMVTLQCDAGNQNVTTYTFYRDQKTICTEPHVICRGSFLDFRPISGNDNGIYTCSIQNPVSTSTSNSLNVTVLDLTSPTNVVNGTFGGSINFDVFVRLPENYHIEWTFGETGNVTVVAQIYLGGIPQYQPQYRGRSELFINGTLRINNLTYADKGDYNLYVFDQKNFSTHIKLYELQLFPTLHAPSLHIMSDRIVAGNMVTLQCDAGNQNVTTYTFYRDQKTICTEPHVICRGSFLDFRPISGNDNGIYTCSIQNPVSTSTSNSLNVTVSDLTSPTNVVNGTFGGSINFDVFVRLPENYHIEWTFGETGNVTVVAQIYLGGIPQYQPQYRGRSELFINGTLRINNLTYADKGDYNLYVFDQKNFSTHIKLYELQLFPTLHAPSLHIMSDRIAAGNIVTLQCDAGNQNVTTYTFYRDQKTICTEPHVICRGSFLDFRPISGNDNGIYTCSIQNPVSTSTSNSLNLAVSDLASPTNVVNGTFGGSINLDVFVPLPENYHIKWTFGETGNVTVVAQIFLGGIPQCHPQYRGRCELFINGTLRLNNLMYADKGEYNLYVFDQKNFTTHTKLYELQLFPILHAPSLHILSDRIVAGTNVTLQCDAGNQNVTTYTFYRDQKTICTEPHVICRGSFLDFRPISGNDNGIYTCSIQNPVSTSTSNSLNLAVSDLASPTNVVNGAFGGSVNFDVFVRIPENYHIEWTFGETGNVTVVAQILLSELPQFHPQYRGRCELFINGTLRINNLMYADEGDYNLYVFDQKNFSTHIKLYELQLFPILHAPSLHILSDRIVAGTNVTLQCDAGNQNVTTYTFYRDQKTICTEPHVICRGSFLDFRPITGNDNGIYTCSIQNPVSTSTSNSLNVTVPAPVSAVTLTSNTSGVLRAGEDSVSLYCSAQGSAVTFSWSLNGKPVPPNPPYYITQSDSPPNSNLTIRPVSKNDTGPFTCTATNLANSETSNALILSLAYLASPTNVVNGAFGESVNFDGFVPLSENYHIKWTFGETGNGTVVAQIFLGGIPQYHPQYRGRSELFINGTLRLNNLMYADKGDYYLYVLDQKNFTTHIKFYELQLFPILHAPSLHILSDRIVAGNIVTLQCDAGNQNVTTYTFYRDQKTICTEPHVICRGSFLDFRPITGNDNGIYTCSIQNPVSTSTSNSRNVTVSDLASPTNVANGAFGGSVDFDVFVPLPDIYHIEWTFGETGNVTVVAQIYIGEFPQFHPQYRGRCELFINGTLRLNNLTYADEGDYNLYVFDQNNFTTHIKLYELQLFPILHAPSLHILSDRIVAGTNVTLQCDAGNQNVTTYTFYRDQKTICTEPHVICRGSFLDFRPISGNDNGIYTCSIQNPVSTSTSNSQNLAVTAPVSAVTLTSNTSGVLRAGEDSVSLYCSAQGSVITFSWSLNGKPVPPNPPYYITQSDSPPNSNLIIRPVSKNDTGPFTCTASNLANSETGNALRLSLAWNPEGDVLCLAESGNDGYVVLGCSWPGGNPPANVTMKFNNILKTAWTTVTRNVSRNNNLQGSNLTCLGDQKGKTSLCELVFEPPQSPQHNNSAIIEIIEGEPVAMTVNLIYGLHAEFTWFYFNPDPVPVPVQSRRKFIVDSDSSKSSLLVSPVTVSDSGIYKCIAVNLIGNQTFNFNLRVKVQDPVSRGMSAGKIVGIIIGVLACLIIIAVVIFILIKRTRRNKRKINSKD